MIGQHSRQREVESELDTLVTRIPGEVAQKSHLVNGTGNITPPTDKGVWDALGDGTARAEKSVVDTVATTMATNLNEKSSEIKSKTDLIVSGGATESNVTAVGSAVSGIPAAVWSYTTRTLTSFAAFVDDIWDYLTSAIVTPGSIGKFILDLKTTIKGASDRDLTQVYTALTTGATGEGTYPVDHNFETANNLSCYKEGTTAGIGGIWVYAYLKADFDAGLRGPDYRKGVSKTVDDGTWQNVMMLVPGEIYRIVFQAGSNKEEIGIKEITIPDE